MKLTYTRDYSIAFRGCEVHNFHSGDTFEITDEEVIRTSLADGAAVDADAPKPEEPKPEEPRKVQKAKKK